MKRVRAGRVICGANEFATDGGKRSFKEPALRWSVAVGGGWTKGASTVARRAVSGAPPPSWEADFRERVSFG